MISRGVKSMSDSSIPSSVAMVIFLFIEASPVEIIEITTDSLWLSNRFWI